MIYGSPPCDWFGGIALPPMLLVDGTPVTEGTARIVWRDMSWTLPIENGHLVQPESDPRFIPAQYYSIAAVDETGAQVFFGDTNRAQCEIGMIFAPPICPEESNTYNLCREC